MATKLKVLKISSVDLVDEGSCGDAHITLIKNKGGNSIMDFETLKKSLTPEELVVVNAEIAKAKAEMPEGAMSAEDKAKLEADKVAAEGEVAKVKGELETLKKSATTGTQTEEDILKSANLDPAIRAILESNIAKAKAAEVAILKMQEVTEQAEFIAKAKEVSFIPEAETKVVELLKSVKGVAGAQDNIMTILKSVNTLIEKGGAFQENGSNGTNANGTTSEDAWNEIEKAAAALVVKGAVTKAKSIEIAIQQNPELYKNYTTALRNE